jgi:hypothetical protein
MTELNTRIELIVSEIIGATRKAKTLEDLGQANTNGINDITKLVKNLSLSGVVVPKVTLCEWEDHNKGVKNYGECLVCYRRKEQ